VKLVVFLQEHTKETTPVTLTRLRSRVNIAGESFVSNVWGVGYRLGI
jgi:DNA-binding response OmpR family regulator